MKSNRKNVKLVNLFLASIIVIMNLNIKEVSGDEDLNMSAIYDLLDGRVGYGIDQGLYPIPSEGQVVDVSSPDHIIGTGTPESCTAEAFIEAVAQGGTIVFNGGSQPFTITLDMPAKVFNDANPDVVIDGGGLVTLSGGGTTRILYMNTCDPDQTWTTPHCNNQDHPRLVVQNITFANGNSIGEEEYKGGGAIFIRGGRFKAYNCRFINNVCDSSGPDVGGGAIRVFDQYNDQPVYIVNCTFGGGQGLGNMGSNGGALSSIGVSWTIINSLFSYNEAIGNGGNPAQNGTPGGGSGGAIYNDGNEMTLKILGSVIENNRVNAYGGAVFFVSNNHTGNIYMDNTYIGNNPGGSWYPVYDSISMHSDTLLEMYQTGLTGNKTSASVTIYNDEEPTVIEAYNYFEHNYFKLRDIASLLSESSQPFEVTWDDELKSIIITTDSNYTSVGNELSSNGSINARKYNYNQPRILIDGESVTIGAYNIDGYNYYMLRDIANLIDFDVYWDYQKNGIVINSNSPYRGE